MGNPFSNKWPDEALNQAAEGNPSQRSAKPLEIVPLRWPTERPQSGKIAIKAKNSVVFIDPKEMVSVHAEGNYVLLQKSSGSQFLRATISEMVNKLEPYGFIRIHRSLLVNSLFVEEIRPYSTGDYGLRITGGKQYTVSLTYKKNLRSLASELLGRNRDIRRGRMNLEAFSAPLVLRISAGSVLCRVALALLFAWSGN